MERKLLLINPAVHPDEPRIKRFATGVPAGLLSIAGYAREQGIPVRIHNEQSQGRISLDDLKGTLVGITSMTTQVPRAKDLALQALNAGAYGVLHGGIHPTVRTREMLEHGSVVRGEIEGGSLTRALVDYVAGRKLADVYSTPVLSPLCGLPLASRETYQKAPKGGMQIISNARGCPLGCDYCTVHLVAGKTIRSRPTGEVIKEMEARGMFSEQSSDVFFASDSFGTPADRDLLKAVRQKLDGRDFRWLAQVGLATFTDESFLELADSVGNGVLAIGVESPFREELQSVKHGIEGIDVVRAFAQAKNYLNLTTQMLLMTGFDFEPPDAFSQILSFVNQTQPDGVSLSILTPFPGTRIADKLADRIFDEDWINYDAKHLVYLPRYKTGENSHGTMTPEDFMQRQRYLLQEIDQVLRGWSNGTNLKIPVR